MLKQMSSTMQDKFSLISINCFSSLQDRIGVLNRGAVLLTALTRNGFSVNGAAIR